MNGPFFVYLLASWNRPRPTLYTGVTNDLERRLAEHRIAPKGFTGRYHATKLVYFESTASIREAIVREKQIKGWSRARKVDLVEIANPSWRDLSVAANLEARARFRRESERRSD